MVLATLPPALQSAGQPSSGEPSIFGRLSRLPAFRPATRNLLTISLESESAVSDFESAFSMDAALAADLLGLANSPLFGLRTQVLTIRHAIAMLGLETVRSLALTITMTSYWQKARWNDAIRGPWRHSVATAVIAEALGAADTTRGPLLYTGGLMHDIGRLALFQISPAKYQQILATEFASTQEYLTRENLLFDCGHDDAGAFLAMAWGFAIASASITGRLQRMPASCSNWWVRRAGSRMRLATPRFGELTWINPRTP